MRSFRVWPVATVLAVTVLMVVSARAAVPPVGQVAFVRFLAGVGHPRIFEFRSGGAAPRQLALGVTAAAGPAWSRDGRRLAFVGGSNVAGSSDITGANYLYVWSAGRSHAKALTPRGVRIGGAAWSPDGRRIVFVRSAATGSLSSLWTVRSTGGGSRRLTSGSIDLEPSWSPDGRSIAFVRIDPASYQSGVWIVGPNGQGLHRILAGVKSATDPVWSPDGARMLFEDGRAIYTVRPDGKGLRRIVSLAADAQGAVEDPQPSWSPDGRWIVFCQFRTGAVGRSDLWVVGSGGSGLRRLTSSPELDRDPSWGP